MTPSRRLDGWTVSRPASRREFLKLGAVTLLAVYPSNRLASAQDSLAGSGPAGKLWDPARAGRPLDPSTAADNDAAIQAIEKQLKCTCGCSLDVYTCRTTDFTCTVSPAMHREVLALAAQGMSGPQILDDFVARNGEAILMAPPKHGFNLAGYFVPGLAILAAGVVLTVILRRWTRAAAGARALAGEGGGTPSAPPAGATHASPEELERLQRELDRFSA